MTDKYKVPQAVMDELEGYKSKVKLEGNGYWNIRILLHDISCGSELGKWIWSSMVDMEREQAVIDYVLYDDDNFEVKTPTWVIVAKHWDENGTWPYLYEEEGIITYWTEDVAESSKEAIRESSGITDPKLKDALLYANKDFEAIEVEE